MSTLVSGIYTIFNTLSNKIYIGQAQNIKRRWQDHKSHLRGGYHRNKNLQIEWNIYGELAFEFSVLEYCQIEHLNEREQYYIEIHMQAGNCYNIAKHPQLIMRGRKHSITTIEKMRISALQRPPRNQATIEKMRNAALNRPPISEATRQKLKQAHSGANNHRFGIHLTEETKNKISSKSKGRHVTEETRDKLSKAGIGNINNKGKRVSEETRKKMQANNKGQNNPYFGKHHNPETRQKLSEARTGTKHTDETKRKMSEAQKLKWVLRRGEITGKPIDE